MNIADLIIELRNKSYDSGWISGKIEAGGSYDADAQSNCIAQRNKLQAELKARTAALVEQNDNMRDSLEWLTKLICGISKDHPEKATNQEWQDAIESGREALVEGKKATRNKE